MVNKMVKTLNVDYLVVGGGISGLSAANNLADKNYRILLVDMDYELGGIYRLIEDPKVNHILYRQINKIYNTNCEILLRTAFIGFKGDKPILVSPRGVYKVKTKGIIMATGAKAPSLLKLMIFGDRVTGVFGFRSALRMIRIYKYTPGRRPVIYGDSILTNYLYFYLTSLGCKPIVISEADPPLYIDSEINIENGRVLGIYGEDRIKYIKLEEGSKIECDSFIICIKEPNTLPIKLRKVNYRTGGPIVDYKLRCTSENVEIELYFVGDCLASFEDPKILHHMTYILSEYIDKEYKSYKITYDRNIRYIVPEFIPEKGGKVFIKLQNKCGYIKLNDHMKVKVNVEDIIKIPSLNCEVNIELFK